MMIDGSLASTHYPEAASARGDSLKPDATGRTSVGEADWVVYRGLDVVMGDAPLSHAGLRMMRQLESHTPQPTGRGKVAKNITTLTQMCATGDLRASAARPLVDSKSLATGWIPMKPLWALTGSNRRPLPCKGSALPAELNALGTSHCRRTPDGAAIPRPYSGSPPLGRRTRQSSPRRDRRASASSGPHEPAG